MNGPGESRRLHVTASATTDRRAASVIGDPLTREQTSRGPVVIELVDDEQHNALELFATERPQIRECERPLEEAVDLANLSFEQTPLLQRGERKALARLAPFLMAAVTAAATIGIVAWLHAMPGWSAGQFGTSDDRSAERTRPSFESERTTSIPAVPSSGPIPLMKEPATALDRANRVADVFAMRLKEDRSKPEMARPQTPATAAISTERRETPGLRELPVPVPSTTRTAEAAALPEPRSAPPLGSLAFPPVGQVQPAPVATVAAVFPPTDPVGPQLPRLPASDTGAIQTVLSRYRTAFRDLDAGAAQAVWPGVDAKALRKAFERLERQDLSFNSCQVAVREIRAVASCQGTATYVPRVGNRGRHDERLRWEFNLRKVDDSWLIDSVSAR
jgi:hypothetical protein